MKYFIIVFLFIKMATCFAYDVMYETDIGGDEDCEIEDHKTRLEILAKDLDPDIYGVFSHSHHEIDPYKKVKIFLHFKEKKQRKSSLIGDMPGIQIAPFISGTFYDSSIAYIPNDFPNNIPTKKEPLNFNGSGRLQVFLDLGRALRMKLKGRILITAGYYSNFLMMSDISNQRKLIIMPTKQPGEFNVGIRIKFGAQPRSPLKNNFTY